LRDYKKAPDDARRLFFATTQLSEILNFLISAGCGNALAPTQHILKALGGLQLGHADPLLDYPEWYQGKKKKRSINETDLRAFAAAVMQCFYKSGRSLDDAADDAIREMRPLLSKYTGAQVRKWREEMMTELATEHLGVFRYRRLTADLNSLSPEEAKVKAIRISGSISKKIPISPHCKLES
jgi:hypothetical protein